MSSHARLATLVAPLILSLTACGSSGTSSGTGGMSTGSAGGPAGSGGGTTTQGNGGGPGSGGGSPASTGVGGQGGGTTSSSAGGSGGGPATLFPAGTICNDSGTPRTPPATVKHVIVILFENEDASSVNENSAPYVNSIAKDCGYANAFVDNCFTTNLPSLPHYLALTSGSNCNTGLGTSGTNCITDDNDATSSMHTLSTTSIFKEVSSWKAYQENMPSACDKSSSGLYACKHNPAAYYAPLPSCSADDVPIAAVTCDGNTTNIPCSNPSNAFVDDIVNDNLPAYAFVTPNLENDMHNGSVTKGDNWLHTYLPLILSSTSYLNGEVVVMALWDEQSTSSFGGATPNFFVSPYITKGTVSQTKMNLFAALRAAEDALGVTTHAGCASGTPPGGTGNCPQYSTANVRSAIGF